MFGCQVETTPLGYNDYEGVTKIQVCDPVSWETLDILDEAWIHQEFFMTSPED